MRRGSRGAMGLSIGHGTSASDDKRLKIYDRAIELYFDNTDIYEKDPF
jgi:hypothetical protein